MPLPTPAPRESKQDFLSRCISNSEIRKEFDGDQAVAVCSSIWERSKVSSTATTTNMLYLECAFARWLGVPEKERNPWNGEVYGLREYYPEYVVRASERLHEKASWWWLMEEQISRANSDYTGKKFTNSYIDHFLNCTMAIRAQASSSDLLSVVENAANKAVMAGYARTQIVWPAFCAIRDIQDFRPHRVYRLEGGVYRRTNKGVLKHGAMSDQAYTITPSTYAELVEVTRQDLMNDDAGVFGAMLSQLGRDAATATEEAFWTMVLENPANHFSTFNENLLKGELADFGIEGVQQAAAMLANMTAENDLPTLVVPDRVFVGMQDAEKAIEVPYMAFPTPYINNTDIRSSETGNPIPNQDSDQWYMSGNPEIAAPFVIGFLNGQRSPTIEQSVPDFAHLSIAWRGYHDWALGTGDPKGAIYSTGT